MAVVNAVLPAVGRTSGALVDTANVVENRMSSQVEVIHATGEDGQPTAHIWIKNVGAGSIAPVNKSDVFFGPDGAFERIPYGGPACASPCWEYTIENDDTWSPAATVHIIVHWDQNLATGTAYYAKIVTPIGTFDEKLFSI